jgi:hypothetical protein
VLDEALEETFHASERVAYALAVGPYHREKPMSTLCPFHVVTFSNHIMALRCRVGSRPQHQKQKRDVSQLGAWIT